MARLRKYSHRKRQFLNPASAEHDSYISVICESSDAGTNAYGTNLVIIADCRRVIQLEFPLGYSGDRRQSLSKINLLLEVLSGFRDALSQESQLIAKDQKRERQRLVNSPRCKRGGKGWGVVQTVQDESGQWAKSISSRTDSATQE